MLEIAHIELDHSEGSHSSSYKPFERPKSTKLETRPTELDEGDLIEYLPCHYFGNIPSDQRSSVLTSYRLYRRNQYGRVSRPEEPAQPPTANSDKDLSRLCYLDGGCQSKNA